EALLAKNNSSASAHLIAANYFRQSGSIKKFKDHVAKAHDRAPDDPEVILATAQVAQMGADEHAKSARKALDSVTKNKEIAQSRAAINEACGELRRGVEKCIPKLTADPPLPWAEREEWLRQRQLTASLFASLVSFEVRLNRLPEAEKAAEQGIAA